MKVAKADAIADGRIYADYVEWRSKNPSDDLMTALLNVEFTDEERRDPQAPSQRGAALHPGGRRRGQRDHRPADRLAGQGARRASRSAPRGRPGSVAADPRDRRDAAVRADGSARSPVHGKGFRGLRPRPCPRAARCCCCSAPPTATRSATPTPTPSTSTATTSATSPSARVCTTASAPTSPGWRAGLRSTSCSTAGRSGSIDYETAQLAPTSTVRGWEKLRIVVS